MTATSRISAIRLVAMVVGFVLCGSSAVMASSPIFVGAGTAAGCTEMALKSALLVAAATRGGIVKFKCGSGPVTITLTALTEPLTPSHNTTIDGGDLITLSTADNGLDLISVDVTVAVFLKNLHFSGRILNSGMLSVANSRF